MTPKNIGTDLSLVALLVQFATYAITGRSKDAALFLRKTYPKLQLTHPAVAQQLQNLLKVGVDATREHKEVFRAIPVDLDSRFELLRRDDQLIVDPSFRWPENVMDELLAITHEREQVDKLLEVGLFPTKSVLFTGVPGVGKTVAATWLAQKLQRPLLTLDLASVMSSYLGKTGNNLRAVLDYARSGDYVLLLDEFDAVAKRRDDASDIGELKRLVTVLLQAIDEWPEQGMLIAATNHPELLDPAIWRRFERVIEFPKPSSSDINHYLTEEFKRMNVSLKTRDLQSLSRIILGMSYSDISRAIKISYRNALISESDFMVEFYKSVLASNEIDKQQKLKIAHDLEQIGLSQRKISSIVGMSRVTIKKHSLSEQ